MIELVIDNSYCQIIGMTNELYVALRKVLFYQEQTPNSFAGRNFVFIKKYLIDKKGFFPTGLLYLAQKVLLDSKLNFKLSDKRIRPKTHTIGLQLIKGKTHRLPYTPYPEQVEAAKAAAKYGRGIIVGPTGCGKSAICALVIEELQVPTLIVVPSVELKNQLTNSLKSVFGASKVGPLNKGKKKYPITVENVDQLDPNKEAKGFDCVVIDEFHRSGASTYRKLNYNSWNNVFYKIGLTATPFRSRDEERLLLESILSQVIYRIEYSVAVTSGYVVPMEAYYIELPKVPGSFKNFASAYKNLVVERKDRNEVIVNMLVNLYKQEVSTLILVKHIEHGLILQQMAYKLGVDVPFAQGINDNNKELIDDFNDKKEPILIGTVGVLGEGVDTRPCEYVILAGGGKSKNQFMQNIGRGFRRYPNKQTCKIIMLKDTSNKWIIDHFKQCVKYLEEEFSVVPVELTL